MTPKIRIIANACITRYDKGEGTIDDIIDSYFLSPSDREMVVHQIKLFRPDIMT